MKGKELELSEVQGMCPGYLKTDVMSGWRFDMRTHLAGDIRENQHEEDRMRDIRVGKRGQRQQVKNNLGQVEEDSTI